MGDSSEGMCVRCGGEAEEGAGGLCDKCHAIPATSVAKVKLACLREGFDVAVPEVEGGQCDLLVRDTDGTWVPVQVKTAYSGTVNTCRTTDVGREPYNINRVSMFAIVAGDEVFFIPIDEANNGGRMSIAAIRQKHLPIGAGRGLAPIRNTIVLSDLP